MSKIKKTIISYLGIAGTAATVVGFAVSCSATAEAPIEKVNEIRNEDTYAVVVKSTTTTPVSLTLAEAAALFRGFAETGQTDAQKTETMNAYNKVWGNSTSVTSATKLANFMSDNTAANFNNFQAVITSPVASTALGTIDNETVLNVALTTNKDKYLITDGGAIAQIKISNWVESTEPADDTNKALIVKHSHPILSVTAKTAPTDFKNTDEADLLSTDEANAALDKKLAAVNKLFTARLTTVSNNTVTSPAHTFARDDFKTANNSSLEVVKLITQNGNQTGYMIIREGDLSANPQAVSDVIWVTLAAS